MKRHIMDLIDDPTTQHNLKWFTHACLNVFKANYLLQNKAKYSKGQIKEIKREQQVHQWQAHEYFNEIVKADLPQRLFSIHLLVDQSDEGEKRKTAL